MNLIRHILPAIHVEKHFIWNYLQFYSRSHEFK